MNPMNDYVRQAEHDELARQIAEWEAKPGNKIVRLPPGLCNWDSLSDRAKINPQVDRAERGAAKAARRALPGLAEPAAASKPAKEPKAPKERKRPGPKPGGPKRPRVTKQALNLMRLLRTHPTIPDLAPVLGRSRNAVWLMLNLLRKKGWVESDGRARVLTRWKVTPNAPSR